LRKRLLRSKFKPRSQTHTQAVAHTTPQHQNSSITATTSSTVTPQKQRQQQKLKKQQQQQERKIRSFEGTRDFPKLKKCLHQIFTA
jgi:hypothetical protein